MYWPRGPSCIRWHVLGSPKNWFIGALLAEKCVRSAPPGLCRVNLHPHMHGWVNRGSTRHSQEVGIVPQRMWVHVFLEARSLGGFLASVPDHLGVDRRITGMPAVAWKQPYAGLSPQAAPVSLEFVEQLWAEQHIPVFASLAALDMNHH